MPVKLKVDSWHNCNHWVRTADGWHSVPQVYIKIGTTWRKLYNFWWETGAWSGCNKLCGGGTQTRTVRCKREDGSYWPDSICQQQVGAKPATSQACNTGSCDWWMMAEYDDLMWVHTLADGSWWRNIWYGDNAQAPYQYYQISSPEFANDAVQMCVELRDTNGSSYDIHLSMCTAQNNCTWDIIYFGHKGECDGGVWYFEWYPKTLGVTKYRCTAWRNVVQTCTEGCSGCTDSGWGYLNCSGGAPAWCYIKSPNSAG